MKYAAYLALCILLPACVLAGCAANWEPAAIPAGEMSPTEAGLTGAFDAYLYVPLGGKTYRYERVDGPRGDATAGERIFSFVEDTGFDQYDWEVYTVKEYPDYSHVWAESGPDYAELYRYSPPKRADEDALALAGEGGCVILEDGDVTSGQDTWRSFVEDTEEGKAASVKVAHYHTLDPENCDPQYYAAYKEDYPALYVNELTFDGDIFTLRWEENGAQYEKTYRYLMRYTGEAPARGNATYDTYLRYVLTNDNTVTWDDLLYGMASSRLGDYIDHFAIYTDLEKENDQAASAGSEGEPYGVFINGEPAYCNFLWASAYTGDGWLAADGMGVFYLLPEIAGELPESLFDTTLPNIDIRLADPNASVSGVDVFDSDFRRIRHRISEDEFRALRLELPPGDYYASYIVVSNGKYIESEGKYEQRGEEYLFKLIIPKEENG